MGGNGSGNSIECWGADQVLQQYDLHTAQREAVYFSVWQGNIVKFVFDEGNGANGLALLQTNLQAWEQNGNSATYSIRFHPELIKDTVTNTTPYNGSLNFKLSAPAGARVSGTSGMADPRIDAVIEAMRVQQEQFQALITSMSEPEEVDEDEEMDEVEQDEVGNVIGAVQRIEQAITNSPVFGSFFEDLKYGFRHWLKKQGVDLPPMRAPITQTMSGTTNNNNMADTQQGEKVNMTEVMQNLVTAWPELPGVLVKLHSIWLKDKEEFRFITKKLNEKVNDL